MSKYVIQGSSNIQSQKQTNTKNRTRKQRMKLKYNNNICIYNKQWLWFKETKAKYIT